MPQKFDSFNTLVAEGYDQITKIQSLWSGYGAIYRLKNINGNSIVVKHINPPTVQQHPRNWNTDISHQRKLDSYQNEFIWYSQFQSKCTSAFKIPKLLHADAIGTEQILIMEDLATAGYPILKSSINMDATKVVLKWLANFHANFINTPPVNLSEIGTYWHLKTRPDEYGIMPTSSLKKRAHAIDSKLNNCNFKTIVHGDAKLANFCFSQDLSQVAAVDFQYVGSGCGMKDVAYFLGSCLSDNELRTTENELLDFYFKELKNNLPATIDSASLIKEWTALYPFAWADFERFLLGWAPSHKKLNGYSQEMTSKALIQLEN